MVLNHFLDYNMANRKTKMTFRVHLKEGDVFTTKDICEIHKIEIERFREWLRKGFILPGIEVSGVQGKANVFNRNDTTKLPKPVEDLFRLYYSRLSHAPLDSIFTVNAFKGKKHDEKNPEQI